MTYPPPPLGQPDELSPLDYLMHRGEAHPATRSAFLGVELLDRPADWGRLREAMDRASRVVIRMRQKVVVPPIPTTPPRWVVDPDFDLDFHLRRVSLPAPGTLRQLLDLAQTIGLTPLDRSRPPWESTLVEGLDGGRAAYIMHAHHVFMDGLALAQLHERVLNVTPEHMPDKPTPRHAPQHRSAVGVAAAQLAKQVTSVPRVLGGGGRLLVHAGRHPRATANYLSSLARVAGRPPRNPSQVLRGGPRRKWRFGTMECEFDDLRRAAKAAGGSLNDALVCALLGGLRRYCAAQGEELQDVPIS